MWGMLFLEDAACKRAMINEVADKLFGGHCPCCTMLFNKYHLPVLEYATCPHNSSMHDDKLHSG
jgi:hypothetical protein